MKTHKLPTAKEQAESSHVEKLIARGDYEAAAQFETRNIHAVRVTKSTIIPGVSGLAQAGTVLLILPTKPPEGWLTAADAARLLQSGAVEPVQIHEIEA